MALLKKILLGLLLFLIVSVVFGYFYLSYDGAPYPSFSEDGLLVAESSQLPSAKASDTVFSRNVKVDNGWFKDPYGRVMNMRGMNVGGSSKLPIGLPSHRTEGFFETATTVSFVGRPFPLNEANEHFLRLRKWGFHFVRLLITWEAIEHAGPGQYDQQYLDYLYQIVKKAQAQNINVFIDPHQDVWSRFTGGDGAPYWTLEAAGFDPRHFADAGAALVHNIQGDPFPKMIWPTNYSKLGAATMFTLFFAGNDFAPQTKVGSIQDYLQDHYIQAIKQVALKLKGLPNVIGFDTLNEPSSGYIGLTGLDSLGLLKMGVLPTPFEGMAAGDGNKVEVGVWRFELTGPKQIEKRFINPGKQRAWKQEDDLWKQQGVWGYDASQKPVILKNDYFSQVNGRRVDFSEDYFKPFVERFSKVIHEVDSSWVIFTEAAMFTKLPRFTDTKNMVNAGHWYDFVTLLTKQYYSMVNADAATQQLVLGRKNIRENFNSVMAKLKAGTTRAIGNQPTLVGEFGIPFDLNDGKAFISGDFSDQEAAIDRSINAMEANMLNYTYWNYTSDNDNAHGDQWNGEDLSLFSVSQRADTTDINSGGRALAAAIRPYPYKISGTPLNFFFNKDKGEFYLSFRNDPAIRQPTEIFVPDFHYGQGYQVRYTKGRLEKDYERGLLLYYADPGVAMHQLILEKK